VVGWDNSIVVAGDYKYFTLDRAQRFVVRALVAERRGSNHRQQSAVKARDGNLFDESFREVRLADARVATT
jgi:hypothetical protein